MNKEKAPKTLSIVFYAAALGLIIIDVYNAITDFNVFSRTKEAFSVAPVLATSKILLIIGVLIFYCCDYINDYRSEKYDWISFFTDLAVLVVLLVTFKSINIHASIVDQEEYFHLDYLSGCFLGFMLIYLARYGILHKRYKNQLGPAGYKRQTFLAVIEAFFALVFAGIFLLNRLHTFSLDVLGVITSAAVLFPAAVYIYVLKRSSAKQ